MKLLTLMKKKRVGVKFKVNDGMSIGAYTVKVEDSTGTTDEEYSNTGAEVTYSIASGLTAYINVSDYDYKKEVELAQVLHLTYSF